MSEAEIGYLIVTLGVLLAAVHVFGRAASKLKQPRLLGEILAGVLLGPFVLGQAAPGVYEFLFANPAIGAEKTKVVLGFMNWLGVLLLMFISGSHVKGLLAKENRRETAWILGVGTPIPFFLVLGLGFASIIPVDALVGAKGVKSATVLVLASAVAVTSIPVISRIFQELGILQTRFASLILGAAVLEDVALWSILAIAVALTESSSLTEQGVVGSAAWHVFVALAYLAVALFAVPPLLARVRTWRWNILHRASPLGYAIFVLFAYIGIAAALGVSVVLAAFLAGFGLAGGLAGNQRVHFADALDAIGKVALAVFIPIYFAIVGYRLVLGREFSLPILLAFLLGSTVLTLIARSLAARLAGFGKLDAANIAITSNARGGPGIVLASVAYDAGIISASFYTALVLTAILTSQVAGWWLRYVLANGWPLLSTNPNEQPQVAPVATPPPAVRPATVGSS